MDEKAGPLKCACADCGEVIRYFHAQVGKTVKCPKCGQESRLPPPPAPNPLADEGEEEAPRRRSCPACGSILGPRDFTCPTCEERRRKNKAQLKTIAAVIGVVVALAVAATVYHNHHAPRSDLVELPPATNVPPPPMKVHLPKSLNDLKIGRFTLERDAAAGVTRIAGTILNDSEHAHRGVNVRLDVLDENGRKVTTLNESITVLAAGSNWRVITRTPDARARDVAITGISEEP